MVAVPPFAAQFERTVAFVETRAPGNEFGDPPRRLANHRINDVAVAQPATGSERVGDMIVEAVLGIDHASDATLRPLARRALQVILRDDRHGKLRINGERCAEARESTAENENVGETVRHPFGAERHQIPRALKRLTHSAAAPCMKALNCSR